MVSISSNLAASTAARAMGLRFNNDDQGTFAPGERKALITDGLFTDAIDNAVFGPTAAGTAVGTTPARRLFLAPARYPISTVVTEPMKSPSTGKMIGASIHD